MVLDGVYSSASPLEDRGLIKVAPGRIEWRADPAGVLGFGDVRAVGRAVAALGGGRAQRGDLLDLSVGLEFRRLAGEEVAVGDPIVAIRHRGGRGLERAIEPLAASVEIGAPADEPPLILARLDP